MSLPTVTYREAFPFQKAALHRCVYGLSVPVAAGVVKLCDPNIYVPIKLVLNLFWFLFFSGVVVRIASQEYSDPLSYIPNWDFVMSNVRLARSFFEPSRYSSNLGYRIFRGALGVFWAVLTLAILAMVSPLIMIEAAWIRFRR